MRASPASLHASLLACDHSNTVMQRLTPTTTRHYVHTPFGERAVDALDEPGAGFNGQYREHLGTYLLGNGYRGYAPGLMRFHSSDSVSPFGAGGLNSYVYCAGDPVNRHDPSGHEVEDWLGPLAIFGGAVAGAFGVRSIVKKGLKAKRVGLAVAGGTVAAIGALAVVGKDKNFQTVMASIALTGLGVIALVKGRRYIARAADKVADKGAAALKRLGVALGDTPDDVIRARALESQLRTDLMDTSFTNNTLSHRQLAMRDPRGAGRARRNSV